MLVWNFVLLLWKATETINESKYNNDLWKQRVEKIISELCNCRICSFFSEMNPFLSKWESFWEKNTLKIFTKFLVSTATKFWFHYIGSFAEVFEKGLKGILSFIILLFFYAFKHSTNWWFTNKKSNFRILMEFEFRTKDIKIWYS